MKRRSSAIVPTSGFSAIQDSNGNGIAAQLEGVIDAQYKVIQTGGTKTIPLYQIDPTKSFSTFAILRALMSSVWHRKHIALAELAIAGYVVLAGTAFGLNMLTSRPVRLTNVPIFDPTATGANIAWFMRPVVGTAADMTLDAQVDMFSSEDATVERTNGLERGRYAVDWED